jgi:hypothetical protein
VIVCWAWRASSADKPGESVRSTGARPAAAHLTAGRRPPT